ncbi:MAG TPA: thiamine phosphate synthase [Acidimicrobiales bacterium]|nr:thiamine phosphate synthase [Acidimicrobiales bacterium]
MTLPRLMVLTDRRVAADAGHDVVDVVADAVGAGAPAVVLREKDLPRAERHRLAMRLRGITADAGAALVVAGDVVLAREVGADGVHLAAADHWPEGPTTGLWVGRSCHTIGELTAAAQRAIADYVTFSPVFATTSKPGYGPALGIDGLAAGCEEVAHTRSGVAVYALGGIGPGLAGACRAAGADGVAVMGAVMRADDPGAVVRSLVDELVAAGADA